MSKRVPFDAAQVRVLLDLADNHRDVATDSQGPSLSVVVPDELWERYEKYQGLKEKKGGKS
jgi:hypothetical protein